jgi:phospholipid N-methyltransferase
MRFIREWLTSPRDVAAIAPSSRALAREITREINSETGPVLELGPGTGVFTRAILKAGVAPGDLTLVERNKRFAAGLHREFPRCRVYNSCATELTDIPAAAGTYGAVISGLGLLNMPRETVSAVLDGVFHLLRPGASLYQFTYGWRVPIPKELVSSKGIETERIRVVLSNLPPASVYRIRRP